MPSIIVTPAELTRFAANLRERVKNMRNKSERLKELVRAAKAVWKDEKYSRLQKDLNDTAQELEKLHQLGERYAAFLDEKARRANRYLGRR